MGKRKITDIFKPRQKETIVNTEEPPHVETPSASESTPCERQDTAPFYPPTTFVFPKTKSGDKLRSCQHHWFNDYPWLDYSEEKDAVLCFYCRTQEKRGTLRTEHNKENTYISTGFKSWKKAPKCFQEHQETKCHKAAVAEQFVVAQCPDVEEMMNKNIVDNRSSLRKYFLDVIRCIKYLARQGIALQGHDDQDNFTQLMLLLGSKDENILQYVNKTGGRKYVHHDVQNEILDIMANTVLRKKVNEIVKNQYFGIMADEYTDVSNKEQLSFCIRHVDENLDVFEDFLGFYELENIKSNTIVQTIKDILLRFNLQLDNCRGQTYDGASNMMGRNSGVATQILSEQPNAPATHCQGHSLNLAVKSLTSHVPILRDTMGTAGEICVLVKFSPKRENKLDDLAANASNKEFIGPIPENVEGLVKNHFNAPQSYSRLDKLCVTRWTVRAQCFQKIIDNYDLLMDLWKDCLKENLDSETRARISGCSKQMEEFKFFFGLLLGRTLYGQTDNLSKTLQNKKMSALSGKQLAELTIKTMEGMRNDRDFDLLFDKSIKRAESIEELNPPTLPRKRKKPNYSILEYVTGHEGVSNSTESYYPTDARAHYKAIYFEALDAIVNAIKDRFNQKSFQLFMNVEQLFLKAIKKDDFEQEFNDVISQYKDDVDKATLKVQLDLLPAVFENEELANFEEIVEVLKKMKSESCALIDNVFTLVRVVLVNGATSATPERSFSMARRLKTWLRATMKQKRFNSIAILNTHKDLVDGLSLIDIANEFVKAKPTRYNSFGLFIESDM